MIKKDNQVCIICNSQTKLLQNNLYDNRYGAPGLYSIYQCINCGYARTTPALKKNKIASLYSKYYPLSKVDSSELKKSVKINSKFINWIKGNTHQAHLYATRGSNVLDIGSGTGRSLIEIKKLGAQAYGVDPDPKAERVAKELKLNFVKGFITDNPYPNIKFNYITATQVLEHEPNPDTFLKAVRNKLVSDGVVIFSFPNIDSIYRKIFTSSWLHWHVPYHISFFSLNSIRLLAERNGFKVTKTKTVTSNLWTALQFSSVLKPSKIGEMNPLWATQHMSKKEKKNTNFKLKKLLFTSIYTLLIPCIVVLNRCIDGIGYGDSIVVFLKKNE